MSSPMPWVPLGGYLAVLAVQRVSELLLSARNLARLRARGAVECGAEHFPIFVLLHAGYPVALVCELLFAGARPGAAWPLWLGLWLAAQALRIVAIATLGERWNVRIVVLPGEPPVSRGLYRWLPHPNYLAVALEFVAAPLLFGAWRTAIAASLLNALAMAVRIPAEERALRAAAIETPGPNAEPGAE
ncbi:MAG: isoprenylcysteine carboxylmethyltransferase family protein [Candidatus Eisenbacteria bacterium]